MKLFIDPDSMKTYYAKSPEWLKTLMVAWADGLNFYLATHPTVKPRVITKFEPWMALSFTEGSIGGDIEKVNLNQLEAFYGNGPVKISMLRRGTPFERAARIAAVRAAADAAAITEPGGSNGFAVTPLTTTAWSPRQGTMGTAPQPGQSSA